MIISDQSMCQKGRFSKIQSHIVLYVTMHLGVPHLSILASKTGTSLRQPWRLISLWKDFANQRHNMDYGTQSLLEMVTVQFTLPLLEGTIW